LLTLLGGICIIALVGVVAVVLKSDTVHPSTAARHDPRVASLFGGEDGLAALEYPGRVVGR
jgi:hypothetical protein